MNNDLKEQLEYEKALIAYQYGMDVSLESYKRTLEYGASAIKYLFIANGAALIAYFTFLGEIINSNNNVNPTAEYFVTPMILTFGLLMIIYTAFCAYQAQGSFTLSEKKGDDEYKKGAFKRLSAIWSASMSLLILICGIIHGICSVTKSYANSIQPKATITSSAKSTNLPTNVQQVNIKSAPLVLSVPVQVGTPVLVNPQPQVRVSETAGKN